MPARLPSPVNDITFFPRINRLIGTSEFYCCRSTRLTIPLARTLGYGACTEFIGVINLIEDFAAKRRQLYNSLELSYRRD